MILRRVIAHFRKQEWTAIFLDFVIVVAGVFVGLQAQEWSRNLNDRQRETQIVEGLIGDLDIDRAQYAQSLDTAEKRVVAAMASLEGAGLPPLDFEAGDQGAGTVDYTFDLSRLATPPDAGRDRLWTDIVLGFHPTPSTMTYDAIAGAGDVTLIRDAELAKEIQGYYNLVSSVGDQNEKILTLRRDALNTGALYGLAPFAYTPAQDYFRLVADNPQLAATIRIMATFVIFHRGEVAAAAARAAALQARLKQYLEDAP
ncbi:MAG: hypothetical protein A3E78_12745 [Alphaproteobacteria bacterium RIFCSPHIGHO2_12_FULL_63_12]|nr:MAG: hypothetical protein A3E78_12745 [Alphaproteobacteria bacterium RIFCSPHIGHO2_12_FULL_63_12]